MTGKLVSPETFPLLVDTVDKANREYWAFSTDAADNYGMHSRHENSVQAAFADGSVKALLPEDFREHCRKSGLYGDPAKKYGYFDMTGSKTEMK